MSRRSKCPVHDNQEHGAEAEELRAAIERLRESLDDDETYDGDYIRDRLQALVDGVDARDSLAWCERRDERAAKP